MADLLHSSETLTMNLIHARTLQTMGVLAGGYSCQRVFLTTAILPCFMSVSAVLRSTYLKFLELHFSPLSFLIKARLWGGKTHLLLCRASYFFSFSFCFLSFLSVAFF